MATGQYLGVSGVARKVTTPYIGVEGVARNVKSGYVGVSGVARQYFTEEVGVPVVLEVAKQTATTYSGETSYADESFILLDIYPKNANSVVNVTYGDLTKTLAFSGTNAQQVYFGTFNGVTDSVDTPESGTLTIEGGYIGFACGAYQNGSKTTSKGYCGCITAVTDWGSITELQNSMFRNCAGLTSISIPDNVTDIIGSAFYGCTNLVNVDLPTGLKSIGSSAFYGCTNLFLSELPSGITAIGTYAFYNCSSLALSELPSGITEIAGYAFYGCSALALSELPSGVTSIGDYAFYYCASLALNPSFFGSEITSIGKYAFYRYNYYYVNIVLPSTLTSVGMKAFSYHQGYAEAGASGFGNGIIGTVTLLSDTPSAIEVTNAEGSFGGSGYIYNLTFIVPKGSKAAYLADEMWSQYSDYIVEAT